MNALTAAATSAPEAVADSFEVFYARLWDRMYRTAYSVAGDAGLAEDAVQTAFAKAYAVWRRIRAVENPEAYVRRIVINELLRSRRLHRWRMERTAHDLPDVAAASDEGSVVARDEGRHLLRSLPPRQRAVLVLRFYEDLSVQQVADCLGCSVGTVKSQTSEALNSLRRRHPELHPDPMTGDQP